MAIIREGATNIASYKDNVMHSLAESYVNLVDNVRTYGNVDFMLDPARALNQAASMETIKEYFVADAYDKNDPFITPERAEEIQQEMEQYFQNDRLGLLEHTNLASVSPMVGMAFPMHKFIMMNMVFDKGSIPKFVAEKPVFTIDIEYRIMVDTEGNELDFFKDQNKLTAAIDKTAALTIFEQTLPMYKDTEIVHDKLGGLASMDHLSIETTLYAIKVPGVFIPAGGYLPDENGYVMQGGQIAEEDGTYDIWVKVDFPFLAQYGSITRGLMRHFVYTYNTDAETEVTIDETFMGTFENDRLEITSMSGKAYEVRIQSRLDTSNARATTCSVRWKHNTERVEIPSAIPINTTVSPEEVRDINALYNINQVTKIMHMTKTVMANYKDDKIREALDESFSRMDETNSAVGEYDFMPREGYYSDHIEWRYKTFLDTLESFTTVLLQKLNDSEMTIAIYGDPDTVRKITPDAMNFTYQTPGSLGPIELDYTRTVVTSGRRVYQFIGSDKLRGSKEFIVVLNPKGTDRIMYRIYDYQLYISNEIRNADNPSLPAIHSFERWKFVEYMPVQGRIQLLNPTGITKERRNFLHVKTTQA